MTKPHLSSDRSPKSGSSLVAVMVLVAIMAIFIGAVHGYTLAVAARTANQSEFLRGNAAAEAAVEVVVGRMVKWVTTNGGHGPSIRDCATPGLPRDPTFPAITGAITFPANSKLSDYTVSTPQVYPVMPDDTYVTDPADPRYLADYAQRPSDFSKYSTAPYYYTYAASQSAKTIAARSISYKIVVTVTPTLQSVTVRQPQTVTRYLRCDTIQPFNWCTFRMGSATYYGSTTYSGPMYLANSVTFRGPTYTDNVLYGVSATNAGSQFTGGGYAAQVKQSPLLSLIPDLMNTLATDANGKRQASFENNTTPTSVGGPAPADMFSTREVIEPPTNPANDTTPPTIRDARIYNQADARIKVSVTTIGGVKKTSVTVVNVDGTPVVPTDAAGNLANTKDTGWVQGILNAINVKTQPASDPNAFIDRTRSTSTAIQSTDIDVGALTKVMNDNPSVFPTGIIYAWDATGLDGVSPRPLTGVRLWNAGVLPDATGLILGSNDPVYIKGDFNTGTTLPSNPTIDMSPTNGPATSTTMARNSNTTTDAQRTVNGYDVKPAGVFGDAVSELSNAWKDANSRNTQMATSTTINLVEGWSTCSANELRADDTYLDPSGRANPMWIEDWSRARRTMSGEELCAWHSKYSTTTSQGGGNWVGDISYNPKAANLTKLNWGTVNFVRDREAWQ